MITDLLAGHAQDRASAPFLYTDTTTYSFGEAFMSVRRFAHVLQAHQIVKGDHVALVAQNGAPWLIAMLAISWLGAVVVAVNNQLVADGLRYTLKQSDAKLIVADDAWIDENSKHLDDSLRLLPLLRLQPEQAFFESLNGEPLADSSHVPGAAPVAILYTSGTTGLPKGVVNSHHCYEAVGRDTGSALELSPADRIMVFLPLFHTNPQMYAVMSALTVGCSLILRPRFSSSTFFKDAKRYGATGFTFVGTVLSILAMRHPQAHKDHTLRFAIGGGAPVDIWNAAHERFGFRIHELYGMTEIGGWVSCNVASDYRIGSCGKLRPSMDVRIFDADDREVPTGTAGEIVVRPLEPDVILSAYYRKPEALVDSSRNFWFHTGDRGMFDADGFLYFHGRSKELIRRGGEMFSPVEIETQLRNLSGVEDCAAVGVPDTIMGEEIKICVVANGELRPQQVVEYLRPLLPKNMLPRYVEFLSVIPKTETEKVQRNKLQYLGDSVQDFGKQA
jgi:acyl-CoA synthetase (AMP-forming)/AMP-acid ligase II